MSVLLNLQEIFVFFVGPWLPFFMGILIFMAIVESLIRLVRGQKNHNVRIIGDD